MARPRNQFQYFCLLFLTVSLGGCFTDEETSSEALIPLEAYAQIKQCQSTPITLSDIPEGLDKTPREDAEAEELTLEAACTIVAPNALYDRVTKELSAMRALYPETRDIRVTGSLQGINRLIIELDSTGVTEFANGTFTEFNNLNLRYGAQVSQPIGTLPGYLNLSFAGRFNFSMLADLYKLVPHVTFAGLDIPTTTLSLPQNPIPQDIPDVCLAVDKDNSFDYYLFVKNRTIRGTYRIDAFGNIDPLNPNILVASTPLPTWFHDCVKWLSPPPPWLS